MSPFFNQHLGELAALFTAFCWTLTATSFEAASKLVGSRAVNLIRLVMAFFLLGGLSWMRFGYFIPSGVPFTNWWWLTLSGLIGFTLGDLLLFQAFVVVGARVSMLIMSLTPPLAGLFGWLILGEEMTLLHAAGMIITISGIALVVLARPAGQRRLQMRYPLNGILLAFGGATGQALGLVLSKLGMGEFDAFSATQIRVVAGIAGFSVLYLFSGYWPLVWKAVKQCKAMGRITIGAFFGPFLGVSFSLVSIKHTTAAVASTIMAIVPILIIPPAILFFKERVTVNEVIGAIIAVGGVVVLFIG